MRVSGFYGFGLSETRATFMPPVYTAGTTERGVIQYMVFRAAFQFHHAIL